MARRRRRRSRVRRARAAPRAFRRAPRRRRSSGGTSRRAMMATVAGSMAYGALRERVSTALTPVTSRVAGPLGTFADEAVMGFLAWQLATRARMPFLKKMGEAGVVIESARAGEALLGMAVSGNGGNGFQLTNTLG